VIIKWEYGILEDFNAKKVSKHIKNQIYIKENDFDDANLICDVCLDDVVERTPDGIITDNVVICDFCNVAVH